MIDKVDKNGSKKIEFNEFIMLTQDKEFENVFLPCLSAIKAKARQDKAEAKQIF